MGNARGSRSSRPRRPAPGASPGWGSGADTEMRRARARVARGGGAGRGRLRGAEPPKLRGCSGESSVTGAGRRAPGAPARRPCWLCRRCRGVPRRRGGPGEVRPSGPRPEAGKGSGAAGEWSCPPGPGFEEREGGGRGPVSTPGPCPPARCVTLDTTLSLSEPRWPQL